jgi:tRNA modification GTPase
MSAAIGLDLARETIVALSSAPGVGALSIVRLSGVDAHAIATQLCRNSLPAVRMAGVRTICGLDDEILDEAVVICYARPRSFTGEDSVEIICHGGWVTAARIVKAAVSVGARPARAGEFTQRAVLNGRLDLLQAEAVNDLIRAESSAGAKQALGQLDKGLSERILKIRQEILHLEALVAYEVDFPEEDDGPQDPERLKRGTANAIESIERLMATAPKGELVRQGAVVAIIGRPNVGKSSLFNALLGRQRALVSEIPGTTRDAIEAVLDVMPVALRLVDTAGLRETVEPVEQLGVEMSREYLQNADVVLACGDSVESLDMAMASAKMARGKVVPVWMKNDLPYEGVERTATHAVRVSSKTGEGLAQLIHEASGVVTEGLRAQVSCLPAITHARHQNILERARGELIAFHDLWCTRAVPITVSAVHLREAARILEELIGPVEMNDVLESLFSTFCVGK